MKRFDRFLTVLAALLLAFGFNTLDAMVWQFYYNPWREWYPNLWGWTPSLFLPVWPSYILGVFCLGAGCFILGYESRSI